MSPAAHSALGHIELCDFLIGKYRKRIEDGDQIPDVKTLERWIKETEEQKKEWQRALDRIKKEDLEKGL